MTCLDKILIILLITTILCSQTIYEQTLYENGEQLDIFAYQLPENFDSESTYPLLVAFHQWGGDHMSTFSTTFDEESNQRRWIFLSPLGGSTNNYSHQGAQYMVEKAMEWMMILLKVQVTNIYFYSEKKVKC